MLSPLAIALATLLPHLVAALPQQHGKGHPKGPAIAPENPRLNLTTLAGNDRNESVIECWSIANLSVSNTPGIQGALVASLGDPTAFNYFNIPGKFDGGLHNAPAVQFVWYTSGTAVLSLPTSNDTATIKGGANGLLLAADTANVSAIGHRTVYPTKERTVGLVLPLTDNTVPMHTVLHAGACTEADGLGYLDEQRHYPDEGL